MLARAALAFAGCVLVACTTRPEIELSPWQWTWSQASLGATVIRYGYPEHPPASDAEPEPEAAAPAGSADPVRSGANETRFASHRYDCAGEGRAACTVFLDFWLIELEPPLAAASLLEYRARFEHGQGDVPPASSGPGAPLRASVRDSRGREWYQRVLGLASGARFTHYSRPIDTRLALAITAYTTRAPDRLAASDLARDAIDRVFFAREWRLRALRLCSRHGRHAGS